MAQQIKKPLEPQIWTFEVFKRFLNT